MAGTCRRGQSDPHPESHSMPNLCRRNMDRLKAGDPCSQNPFNHHVEDQRTTSPWANDSPHPSLLNRPVIPVFFSPQDDATVRCWGSNRYGALGLGDHFDRGPDANGPCPPSSNTELHRHVTCACPVCPHPCPCSPRADMGTNLPSVDLGPGRTAVAVSAGYLHTCALLVRLPSGRL